MRTTEQTIPFILYLQIHAMRFLIILLFIHPVVSLSQGNFPAYHDESSLLFASPGAYKFGLYGFENPAMLNYLHQGDAMFTWTDNAETNFRTDWGLFLAGPNAGFGVVRQSAPGLGSIADYRFSFAGGNRDYSLGFAYGFVGGNKSNFNRSNIIKTSLLLRPDPHISAGVTGTFATASSDKEGVVDLAIRPTGNEIVALFGDYAFRKGRSEGAWSAGAVVEALPGLRLAGRYFDTKAFTVGVEISLGVAGFSMHPRYSEGGTHEYNTYAVRLGAYDRNIFDEMLLQKARYVDLNMFGPLTYQRFVFFDNRKTLADILATIELAKSDRTIAGIAINTSGMTANQEMLWEIRARLKEFKAAGKHVVVFVDRPGMKEYHFASVADRIVMDPTGMIVLQGYVGGRTFLKGTLEKIGIGFDEYRLFKYKSANETLSRTSMSEADREQRQRLVDEFYRVAREEISESRGFSPAEFDALVNDEVLFLPKDAVEKNLVDTIGRWEEVKSMITSLEGSEKYFQSPGSLKGFRKPYDNRWGERPVVAVVYALGACDMDEGIRARSLVKDVERAVKDSRVKAIVLRVDSPGGDGMASDYIAEALKKGKGKKPIIVSQGAVAASGGYWLSMYADTIVASPVTVTGSIGVAGGWMYNKGIKESMGMSTDFVKAGAHADVGFGFSLPLIGIGLPDRNLSDEEYQKVRNLMTVFYKDFLTKVAEGRGRSTEEIEQIAQGRVWSGADGKKNGLVDVLGGLADAVAIARTRAGIEPDQDIGILELPQRGWFDFSGFIPRPFEVDEGTEQMIRYLKFMKENNGRPLPMLPMDFWEESPFEFSD